MKTTNAPNERIKRVYFAYMKEARRYSEQSIDAVAKALNRFENYTRFKDFKTFHPQQAIGFKSHLAAQVNDRTKEVLSKATLYSTLTALKGFFLWLAGQPGYKSKLTYSDGEYFNLGRGDTAIAKAHREQSVPTIEQIRHVISTMPIGTDIERRNRALIAFVLLTGARDGAIASMKLKHVDLIEGKVEQDAREVKTKFRKTFATYFFPVGDDIRQIVTDWVNYLRGEKLWGLDDPLFPATRVAVGASRHFEAVGLDRKGWSSASPICAIFKDAFTAAGLPYFNPHRFRKTLGQFGERTCQTPEAFKAWSQNLGHESVLTTFSSYGQVATPRQAELIRQLGKPKGEAPDTRALERRLAMLEQRLPIGCE